MGEIDGEVAYAVDGEIDWTSDGKMLGEVDGEIDGEIDGEVVGDVDGEIDGASDGEMLGKAGGEIDGETDSEVVGAVDGEIDWASDGKMDSEAGARQPRPCERERRGTRQPRPCEREHRAARWPGPCRTLALPNDFAQKTWEGHGLVSLSRGACGEILAPQRAERRIKNHPAILFSGKAFTLNTPRESLCAIVGQARGRRLRMQPMCWRLGGRAGSMCSSGWQGLWCRPRQ